MGENCGFFGGGPCVMRGARTAVSGGLKRFSQAEIFNLLRENKAEGGKKWGQKEANHPQVYPRLCPLSLYSYL